MDSCAELQLAPSTAAIRSGFGSGAASPKSQPATDVSAHSPAAERGRHGAPQRQSRTSAGAEPSTSSRRVANSTSFKSGQTLKGSSSSLATARICCFPCQAPRFICATRGGLPKRVRFQVQAHGEDVTDADHLIRSHSSTDARGGRSVAQLPSG